MKLIAALSILFCSSAFASDTLTDTYKSLLSAIGSKDIEKIIKFVNPNGVVDADSIIPKSTFIKEIHNNKSYLYKSIFKERNVSCEGSTETFVSPYEFIVKSKGQYTVKVSKVEGFENLYGASATFVTSNCTYKLFPRSFILKDGIYYLYDYFYP